MKASTNRILTTHAGSLPRPQALSALHAARFAGKATDAAELATAVEAATRAVLEKQILAGIDIVNNGEAGRESFFTYVQHRMTGFGGSSSRPIMADLTRYPGYLQRLAQKSVSEESVSLLAAPCAVGDVRYQDSAPIRDECRQLHRLLGEQAGRFTEAFVSSPSPGIVAAAMHNDFYPDLAAYVAAVAEALRVEYRSIVDAGFVLQIDAPDLAMERHTLFQDKPIQDFLAFARTVVDAINGAIDGMPRQQIRLHVCWGNYEGPHDLDVGLEEIWPEIARAQVGAFLLSMANPRHAHEATLFRQLPLPAGALLIPGVIDTTTNYVEHPLTVADRIERVATALGDPGRVIAGTDCGFETSAGFGSVVEDVVWAKLRSLREGANIASKRLFG
jgi:5-methyltetrahydropteroyltriglutamate--homocysteine methyltransferase